MEIRKILPLLGYINFVCASYWNELQNAALVA